MERLSITLSEGEGVLFLALLEKHAKPPPLLQLLLHRPVTGRRCNRCSDLASTRTVGDGFLCLERRTGLHGSGRRRISESGGDDDAIGNMPSALSALLTEVKRSRVPRTVKSVSRLCGDKIEESFENHAHYKVKNRSCKGRSTIRVISYRSRVRIAKKKLTLLARPSCWRRRRWRRQRARPASG